jgi:hypothetical protein
VSETPEQEQPPGDTVGYLTIQAEAEVVPGEPQDEAEEQS